MTAAHRLSMSKVSLALQCAYPFRADVDVAEKKDSYSARIGRGAHKPIEQTLRGLPIEFPDLPPAAAEKAQRYYANWLAWWRGRGSPAYRAETVLVIDVEKRSATASYIVGGADRDYGDVGPNELPGTADAILSHDGSVEVWDWKTGDPGYVDPAAQNDQLRTLGLAAALHYGTPEAHVSLLYLGGPKAASDPETRPHVLDEMDLDAHFARVRNLLRRLPTAEPTPGSWCERKWCPLRKTCSAHLERQVAEAAGAT